LSPVVNFSNIFEQLLCQYSFAKKLQCLTGNREKLRKALLYKKGARKTLVKFSPGNSRDLTLDFGQGAQDIDV